MKLQSNRIDTLFDVESPITAALNAFPPIQENPHFDIPKTVKQLEPLFDVIFTSVTVFEATKLMRVIQANWESYKKSEHYSDPNNHVISQLGTYARSVSVYLNAFNQFVLTFIEIRIDIVK